MFLDVGGRKQSRAGNRYVCQGIGLTRACGRDQADDTHTSVTPMGEVSLDLSSFSLRAESSFIARVTQ